MEKLKNFKIKLRLKRRVNPPVYKGDIIGDLMGRTFYVQEVYYSDKGEVKEIMGIFQDLKLPTVKIEMWDMNDLYFVLSSASSSS